MKAIHIIAAMFFAATLGAYAQGPAKRTMPKRGKAEVVEANGAPEGEGTPAARPATPPKSAPATPPAKADAATPPKAAPAAPVKVPPKPAATTPAKPAGGATPAKGANRPGAQGRPGAAAAQTAKPAPGGSYRDFPTASTMPADAAWRREIYRSLDLTKEANAVLYFPIMPTAERQNLFCFLFRQILRGNIKAYKYTPDTNEHFDDAHIVKGKALMDTHKIYYEVNDGKIRVNDADLPSEDVKLYYVKECVYYDQHSASFRTKITALCPVMCSGYNDFGEEMESRIPLFWINYEEAAPYLAKLSLMGSSMNNAAMISADDYFTMGRYDGDIYKTTNLQDKILIQSDDAQEAIALEQKRIEGELEGFQRHVWGHENERLLDVYGNPVLDDEGLGIAYNEDGQLIDGRGRRIAFVVAGKDSTNVVSDNPELDPLPEIVLLNERGFAVDELGNPLLKEDGSPIEITDVYPEPSAMGDGKKKSNSRSAATTRRGSASADAPTRRGSASSSSGSRSSGSKPSTSKPAKSSSQPAKSKAPKAGGSSKPSSKSGPSVRRERH